MKRKIFFEEEKIGLKAVDQIRKETEVPALALEKINETIRAIKTDKTIQVSEDIAKRSNHFEDVPLISVMCPNGRLNEFVEEYENVLKNNITGEILSVRVDRMLNEERTLEAWEAAGFPLEWAVEGEKRDVKDEKTRLHFGVEEHMHDKRDYWHPIARVHPNEGIKFPQ